MRATSDTFEIFNGTYKNKDTILKSFFNRNEFKFNNLTKFINLPWSHFAVAKCDMK